jgi:hypothetical protein
MQKGAMAEKKKVFIDGEEIPGLVSVQELVLEKGTIEVPEFHKIRQIQNGISRIPAVELTYKVERNSKTLKFWKDWYKKDEVHDVTIVSCDAHGVEFDRDLLPGCECNKFGRPNFDGASPTYAQLNVRIIPWDVVFTG